MTDVYTPREDTFLLLDAALDELKTGDRVLEVGCGSGRVIGEVSGSGVGRVTATDINPEAVRRARDRDVEAVRTDLFHGIDTEYDLVLFNPPYLPEPDSTGDRWSEMAVTGGESGSETLERFLASLDRVLAENGRCLVVVSTRTGLEAVEKTIRGNGYEASVVDETEVFFETLYVLKIS